jgi:hypothetical protein
MYNFTEGSMHHIGRVKSIECRHFVSLKKENYNINSQHEAKEQWLKEDKHLKN